MKTFSNLNLNPLMYEFAHLMLKELIFFSCFRRSRRRRIQLLSAHSTIQYPALNLIILLLQHNSSLISFRFIANRIAIKAN